MLQLLRLVIAETQTPVGFPSFVRLRSTDFQIFHLSWTAEAGQRSHPVMSRLDYDVIATVLISASLKAVKKTHNSYSNRAVNSEII